MTYAAGGVPEALSELESTHQQHAATIPDSEDSPERRLQLGSMLQPVMQADFPNRPPARAVSKPSPGKGLHIAQCTHRQASWVDPCSSRVVSAQAEGAEAVFVGCRGVRDSMPEAGQPLSHEKPRSVSVCSAEALPGYSPPEVCTQCAAQTPNDHTRQQQQQQQQEQGLVLSTAADAQHRQEQVLPTGFGTPIAPAPAGPDEHVNSDTTAAAVSAAAAAADVGAHAIIDTSRNALARAVRMGAYQKPEAQKHCLPEGSQPSSSSLKRVPETPDSAENRSQPTQSPSGALLHLQCCMVSALLVLTCCIVKDMLFCGSKSAGGHVNKSSPKAFYHFRK